MEEELRETVKLKQAELQRAIGQISIERLPIGRDFHEDLKQDLAALAQRHHLAGLATKRALYSRLPDTHEPDLLDKPLRILPWGWPGRYGASLTLTPFFDGSPMRTRISLSQSDTEAFNRIEGGEVTLVLVRGQKPVAAYRVNFIESPASSENIRHHIDNVRNHTPTLLKDASAHYWETIKCQTVLRNVLTVNDRLSLGWYEKFDRDSVGLDTWLAGARDSNRLPPLDALEFPPLVRDLLSEIHKSSTDIAALSGYLSDRFQGIGPQFMAFVSEWVGFTRHLFAKWEETAYLLADVVGYHLSSSKVTDCGRKMAWYDFRIDQYVTLDIEPKNFPPTCNPEEYWQRLQWDAMNYAQGMCIGGGDFPIGPEAIQDSRDSMPTAVDAASVSASADALLEEAVANKIGTIPPKAHVDLGFGPFTYLEITESDPNVLFICRNATGEFLPIIVEPRKNHCSFNIKRASDSEFDQAAAEKIDAGVKLLLAAIVRDFWVIEKRETVFGCRVERSSNGRSSTNDDSPRIVYVPRVRYSPKADVEKCTESLSHSERRSHFVRGFVRRSPTSSAHQLILAQRYGFEVPKGYTFVRPHERGKSTRDVIYRSRSALQCLYVSHEVAAGPTQSFWFKFECDVRTLMERLGFTVQHVAASRRGDNGIDVFATKGDDLETVNWVIQCKCWRNKIYPATVRELIGTLEGYPRGTRGMIVTTSDFSSGAIAKAKESDIRLMNGEEFLRLSGDGQGK